MRIRVFTDCSKCENESICKYISEMKKTNTSILNINELREEHSPIDVAISCARFKNEGPTPKVF